MQPVTHILGIDIAKDKFDVDLRQKESSDARLKLSFNNNLKGFKSLHQWLIKNGPHSSALVHACMESTSRYGEALALFLYQNGYQVSMVNPRRTSNYAASQLSRNINDKIDARLIADFCAAERETLALWEPLSPEHQQLREMTRTRQTLVEERERFAGFLETASGLARKIFLKQIAQLDRQIRSLEKTLAAFIAGSSSFQSQVSLAQSVPGVGLITAATVIAELPPIPKIGQAAAAVALFGLDPIKKTSGKSVDTRARLSRMGSRRGRRALYMPALSALCHNPIIRAFGQRLRKNGRTGKYVVVAAMRKLLRLIYGVLKHGKPFDPNWNMRSNTSLTQQALALT